MAFSFSYIDLPKESQSVSFSIKMGGRNESTVSSNPMLIEEFKIRLNAVNKTMKEKSPLTYSEAIEIVCAEFVPNCTLGNLPQKNNPGKRRKITI